MGPKQARNLARRQRRALCAGAIVLHALSAGADPAVADRAPERGIETIVVTSSLDPLPRVIAPAAVDVVSGAELERAHYDGLLDALRHRPGLHADAPGGRGSRGSVYTRGLDPNHTVVLFDGIPLNDSTNARGGSFDFSNFDNLDAIERVEIVRGPVSAVQGSDALAGAIQVITRDGRGPDTLRIGASGGRFGYARGYARASGERGPFDALVAGSYTDEGEPAENGDYRGGTALAAVGLALPGDARLRGSLLYRGSQTAAFPEFSGGPELAAIRSFEHRETRSVAGGLALTQRPAAWLDYTLSGWLYRRREDRMSPGVAPDPSNPFDPGVPAEPDSRDWLRRGALALRGTAQGPAGLALTLGSEIQWEHGQTRGVLVPPLATDRSDFDLARRIAAPFAEARWLCTCGAVLVAGVRSDFARGDAAEVMPRVSGSAPVFDLPLRIRGSYGEGFKRPSFFALGNPSVGNPDLAAERSRGWDAGLQYARPRGRISAELNYFDLRVRNLIDFDVNSFTLRNLGEVRSTGVELALHAKPIESLTVTGHGTYTESVDVETGDRLRNRPRWRGGVALDWRATHALSLRLEALFVGDTLDASVPTGRGNIVTLDGYPRVDFGLAWDPFEWLRLNLTVDNLFDAHYQEAIGYPAPGIRPRAGLTLRL
jgi:vitamin B12 transporter